MNRILEGLLVKFFGGQAANALLSSGSWYIGVLFSSHIHFEYAQTVIHISVNKLTGSKQAPMVKMVNIPLGDVYPRLIDILGNLKQNGNATRGIDEPHLRRRC